MDHAIAVLRTHPRPPGTLEAILSCIRTCADCAAACSACADACLAEDGIAGLRACIRSDLDCATICAATGTLLSRVGALSEVVVRAQLAAWTAGRD